MSDAACSHMFVIEWMSLTLYVPVSMEGETEKHTVGMDIHNSDIWPMDKKTCLWNFSFKMHRQWTSKIGVFHSWIDRLKKGGFWGFHGQKMLDFPKVIFAIIVPKLHFLPLSNKKPLAGLKIDYWGYQLDSLGLKLHQAVPHAIATISAKFQY